MGTLNTKEVFDVPISMSAESRKIRAQKGVAVRTGNKERAATLDAEFRAQRLADYINEMVDAAPPLSATQRAHLAALIQGAPA